MRAPTVNRVLYLVTDPLSTKFLEGQLSYLRTAGFDVELASAAGPRLSETANREGVRVHTVPFVRDPHLLRDLKALLVVLALMRERRPSIVNASTPKAGLIGLLAAWLWRVPVRVYVVRGLRFETERGARRSVLRTTERVAARCATHVLLNSRSLRDVAVREGVLEAGQGEVIGSGSGNGIKMSRFDRLPGGASVRLRYGLRSDAVVIGFVGRLAGDKGIIDLVTAYGSLVEEHADLSLLLVGTYDDSGAPLPAALRDRIEDDDRIVRAGWVEDPSTIYPAMDVLAFPSYREGLPNVPLEAQAVGVPVVGYAATGTVDAVLDGTTGLLVPVGDVGALSSALERLIVDTSLRSELGRAGRPWVEAAFAQPLVWQGLAGRYLAWSVL